MMKSVINRDIVKSLLILIHLIIPCGIFAQSPNLSEILSELNNVISRREEIISKKDERIELKKELLSKASPSAKIDIVEAICKSYDGFRADSALVYAKILCKLTEDPIHSTPALLQKSKIFLARCYAVKGQYERAEHILNQINIDILPSNKLQYFEVLTLLYVWRTESARIDKDRDEYYAKVLDYRDSILAYDKDPVWINQQKALRMIDTDLIKAKDILRTTFSTVADDDENARYIANSLASCYKRLGNRDSASYFYAISSISDIRCGVLEKASLHELALLLFESGDIDHAYYYTNCCLEDAKACGAQLRMMQMAEDMPVIMANYQSLVGRQKSRLLISIFILVLLLVLLFVFIIYMYRLIHSLRDTKNKLVKAKEGLEQSKAEMEQAFEQAHTANISLRESDRIKESFVAKYMKQCSHSLNMLDKFRHQLLKTIFAGTNFEKVTNILRDDSIIQSEQREFMRSFDESFLSLFPTFIEEFNNLLIPEARIELPEGKLLNTDLRIYALIRLGITESEEIADFIGRSLKTVYNYRTNMRNKAIGNRNTFDEDVMHLCSK